ncbi:type III-B CRISPR-associated protein Cas10/Cmr2 [Archaeoglobus sp.]
MSDEFWQNKIRAFLHDPPDKILKIQNHEKRRNEILGNELKFRKDRGVGRVISLSDEMASSLQRIDIEKVKDKRHSSTFYRKHGENYIFVGEPQLRHPITGEVKYYGALNSILPKDETSDNYDTEFDSILNSFKNVEIEAFNELIAVSDSFKDRYFVIWRYYLELLRQKIIKKFGNESIADEFLNLTAYTLSPDHTLFDHADATSAIYGALSEERKPALLMFKLSPVQDFIKNARKERDLWAGSHLLSFLTFKAMKVIVDEFGPDAIVFPHLRGQPFFDKEYEGEFKDIHEEIRNGELKEKLKIANIPNKFLAIVGFKSRNEFERLKLKVVKSVEDTIREIFEYAWNKTITKEILEKTKDELTKLEEKAEREGRDVERYEEALKELERILDNLEGNNLKDYKTRYQQLAEKYFRITIEVLEVPFDSLGDKEESYRKLKEFVKSLRLPEKTEKKYIEWIKLLESFGTYPARPFDLYSLMFELLEEVVAVESRKFEKVEGKNSYKCSLCGEVEAICGENYTLMKALWSEIRRRNPFLIKKNEHLCPICLVKRFYHEWLNEKGWEVEAGFDSVSEVAMRKKVEFVRDKTVTHLDVLKEKDVSELKWLEKYGIEPEKIRKLRDKYRNLDNAFKDLLILLITKVYKGKSLPKELTSRLITDDVEFFYKEKLTLDNLLEEYGFPRFDEIRKEVKDNSTLKEVERKKARIESLIFEITSLLDGLKFEPEKYYAILIMDGDNMGKMLMGDEMKPVKEYLHPMVLNYLPEKAKKIVEETTRLITPATHSAISRALAHFSINIVPDVVKNNNRGELIYAGGDDVLALLPIDSALACAYKVQSNFRKDWNGWNILPAKTMSAGILIVHYKHPLYDALDKARSLEKKAKELGRDCVAVGYLSRSGSYDEVVFNWSLIGKLKESVADYSILDLIIRSKQKERKQPYISERISYDVVSKIENLPNDVDAIEQFLKYELSRHYYDEKDRKKEVLEKLVSSVIECARRVRVTLSREELECVLGRELKGELKKSDVKRVNDIIKSIVRECINECPNVKDSLRSGINSKNGLEELFGIIDDNVCKELDGLILKKQVKGFFILLKILVDCNAELRCSP